MVATEPRVAPRSVPDSPPSATGRIIAARHGLPGSRAVVGGLLVAVAAVGVFAAWSGASSGPSTRYVVATHAIAAGTVLDASDLKTATMDLPASTAGRSFSSVDAVAHAVTLGPLAAGELVQSANVLPGRRAERRPEFSFGIDAERAVAGTLRPGDRIRILVTYGTGASSVTQLVSSRAEVLSVDAGARNGLSDTRRQTLTVALGPTDDVLQLTNATRAGELTLVRMSGVAGSPAKRSYQPDLGDSDASSTPTSSPSSAPPTSTAPSTSSTSSRSSTTTSRPRRAGR